jgi:hypothetical protein
MSKLYPGLIQLDQPIPIHLTSEKSTKKTPSFRNLFNRGYIWFNDDIS